MQLFHDSHDSLYRSPFGAIPTGAAVTLRLRVLDARNPSVSLRLFAPNGESVLPMERSGDGLFTLTLSAGDTPTLLWYDFIAKDGDETLCFANSPEGLGGAGTTAAAPAANSYQITVYDRGFQTPPWFRERIMYQIFPDRFRRTAPPNEACKKRAEYVFHLDWNEPMTPVRHPFEDGPACCDFYGGNLAGIREKLPYLKDLGVGVLYLNPIFEAYSNHRYDTGNYKAIDPLLGTQADFEALCRDADAMGIRIILDGVFSHTGSDSVYFNKYGLCGEGGAYRDETSPYRSWYNFTDYPNYQSWWGCSNLPNVNETEPSYLDFILRDSDAVVKHWLRAGASGWRLDVADELPDEFIKILRREVKAENPNAVIIGEVWEDASHKIAYGVQREYLLGRELDSVMNYPFKELVLSFLTEKIDARAMSARFLSQMENYPPQALYALMNILGTHDTVRVKSLLGGMDEDCGDARLTSEAEELAVKRQKLGVFLQMTFYGVPCIYYGDEAGMQGGRDPHNRQPYPWRAVDPELRSWYKKTARLRNENACLRQGAFLTLYAEGDVYVYARQIQNGRNALNEPAADGCALCAVNRGSGTRTVRLHLPEGVAAQNEVLGMGAAANRDGQTAELTLPPLSAALFLQS